MGQVTFEEQVTWMACDWSCGWSGDWSGDWSCDQGGWVVGHVMGKA